MLPGSLHLSITNLKFVAIPEKVRETLELLGMDFTDFAKYKANRNTKARSKVATTSV